MSDANSPNGTGRIPPARAEAGSVHVIVTPGRTRVVLCGDIDAAVGEDLVEASSDAEAAGQPVEVDARQVTFMDSSGLALIARLSMRCPGRLRVIGPPDVVRFLILVTIDDMVDIVDDVPGAAPAPAAR